MSEQKRYSYETVVATAREWIATPYRHQAACKGAGVDCLGLVRGVFRDLEGREPEAPPAYTPDWAELPGVHSELEPMLSAARRHLHEREVLKPEPGDVLIFRMSAQAAAKHAAIYVGDDRMIHAYSGRAVAENHMGLWWHRRLVACFAFPGVTN